MKAAEHTLGVKLPTSYLEVAGTYPGGHPTPDVFTVTAQDRTWTSCVGVLLSLDPSDVDNVFEYMRNLSIGDQLPLGLIPIGDDGGGDLLCLDYRETRLEPRVVYFSHDTDEGFIPIADSFKDFLATLSTSGE